MMRAPPPDSSARRKGLRLIDALPEPSPPLTPSLAARLGAADQDAVLQAAADLCERAPDACRTATGDALGIALLRLAAGAEPAARRRFAERLADADWAPSALVRALVLDDIDIARPLIAASPMLCDEHLMAVLAHATLEHRVAVASRQGLSQPVVDAVIDGGEAPVLTALAANARVTLHPDAMARLVEAAHRMASLRGPLTRRPELSAELAQSLYARVGETLRGALEERFGLAARRGPPELPGATPQAAKDGPTLVLGGLGGDPEVGEAEAERRLAAKLEASGQLTPGYLLRILREGRLSLFVTGLSALADLPAGDIRRAVAAETPEALALACAVVGFDRSTFPTVLSLVRSVAGDRPGEPGGSAAAVAQAFTNDRQGAAAAFLDRTRRERR